MKSFINATHLRRYNDPHVYRDPPLDQPSVVPDAKLAPQEIGGVQCQGQGQDQDNVNTGGAPQRSLFPEQNCKKETEDVFTNASGDELYLIEKMLKCKIIRGRKMYLVKWVGYPVKTLLTFTCNFQQL